MTDARVELKTRRRQTIIVDSRYFQPIVFQQEIRPGKLGPTRRRRFQREKTKNPPVKATGVNGVTYRPSVLRGKDGPFVFIAGISTVITVGSVEFSVCALLSAIKVESSISGH